MARAIQLSIENVQSGHGGPFGAVVVKDGAILAEAANRVTATNDPTAHAEVLAMREAAVSLRTYRLTGATIYVTVEPCVMCIGAMINARIARLCFGARDEKAGAVGSVYDIGRDGRLNHRIEVVGGVRAEECAVLLREFFRGRRGD